MDFSNFNVRRQDRLLAEQAARKLLAHAEYGVLSMKSEKQGAYGVPINYAWDGKKAIYLHCAPEGQKIDCIKLCDDVSFCIVGKTKVIPDKFTTEYESIVLECKASLGLQSDERMKALELLLEKYSPEDKETGMEYVNKSFHRTEIMKLDIVKWSGKCKSL
ncbi:nitroimidazol reductase NimA-like FMN-containing flavoprotein (pyridoxamine 5'-phosphate oxidase superfamily) [Methanohalophilus levihalophilus]|uniref:pyridoxamine 5'-phosphate oxidase family protein n=1 Tax=Methanohalophilus levihalophilus TaxID=1431282 RepID=UPI001AE1D6A6|nr:pyridoxamine 5'-phosphate oxidase family protein [Methanohalophilus levihalophilus]MBP2030409.1 nitroimidazol reductase NimA-like FMN-containing flavoprotein (pyridoxamine 5'-phosphate oxidase superfamily) [Methanohalophilus levihalophilus]